MPKRKEQRVNNGRNEPGMNNERREQDINNDRAEQDVNNRNVIEITDFEASAFDIYARLSEVQLLRYREPGAGIFIAESPKVIERALKAGYEPLSFLIAKEQLQKALSWKRDTISYCAEHVRPKDDQMRDARRGTEILTVKKQISETERNDLDTQIVSRMLECFSQIPIYTAPLSVLTKLTGFQLTRGMLCAMNRKPLPDAFALCRNMRRIVVLDHVANPTNVGSIFRSAAALGMDAVLLTEDCSNPLYRRGARVSMGTVFQIPWTILKSDKNKTKQEPEPDKETAENKVSYMECLRTLGFKTVAMALREDSVPLTSPCLKEAERLAVILGAEGSGLSDEIIEACDYTVCIPMHHGVDSLNVGTAAALAFYELCREK